MSDRPQAPAATDEAPRHVGGEHRLGGHKGPHSESHSAPRSRPDSELDPDFDFDRFLARSAQPSLVRGRTRTLQINIGAVCNLACHHCHVESGPNRTERLSRPDCERLLVLLERSPEVEVVDITGGAPEMHPDFRFLVEGARRLGRHVIDRCNLTILFEDGQADLADFLAAQRVEVIASLPCYTAENVEAQRGRGVFAKSIEALQRLNRLGYGQPGSELQLNLVYNPIGPELPPAQAELERSYRRRLRDDFGIEFDALYTITNMPIKRFAHALIRDGRYAKYMSLLVRHFNPATLQDLMCRQLLSVDWHGRFFDCDFDQALGIEMPGGSPSIWDVEDLSSFAGQRIATAEHCFGCTAGAGSSCGGALE
jgi:radical SAM/Cys-rich protein